MTFAPQPSAWTRREQDRVRACARALLLGQPSERPTLGRFALQRLIGRGSQGTVYEASDVESSETVALKTLRIPDATNIHHFKREFRALAGITHENLVQLHELFVEEDDWYFTMELVPGPDFVAHARAGTLAGNDFTCLRHAFGSLALGVHAIHDAGKLHCDLKPSNVRVTEHGRVVVLDYGLVSAGAGPAEQLAYTDAQRGPALQGTLEYMAPELWVRFEPTRSSDVYAMGVMLFAALTGRLPFPGRTQAAVSAKRFTDAPRVRSLAGHVPENLDALCASMLARDPVARPTLEEVTTGLGVQRAVHRSVTPASPASTPFVGRHAELGLLHSALDAVGVGRPVGVFVRGSSGIGKSALLDRFVEQLGERAVVLAGRCYEREALPYKGFDGIIDALVRHLQSCAAAELAALVPPNLTALLQVFPALRRVPGFESPTAEASLVDRQELRQQAFGALKALLCALSTRQPLVLIADDLQWADLDSARLLLELLGPPAAPALLYLGCYRSEDETSSECLRELLSALAAPGDRTDHRLLHLDPLDEAACSSLALHCLQGRVADPDQMAARIAHESAGVPLFVRELAHHVATQPDRQVAPSLAELLDSRAATLPPGAQQALALLALAGRPVSEPVLAEALAGEHERWQQGLRLLEIGGFTRRDAGGAVVVHHDRVRESITASLSVTGRAAMHERLARAYEGVSAAEPEWLIEHWSAAGSPARALEYAIVAAASAAQKLAFYRAASLYRTALELIEPRDARKPELYLQLGEALANAGRGAEAAAALIAASEGTDVETSLALSCRALQQQLRGGNVAAQQALLEQLLAEVGVASPKTTVGLGINLLWNRARVALWKLPGVNRLARPDAASHRRTAVLRSVFREYSVTDPLRGLLFQNQFYAQALVTRDEEAVFIGLAWDTYNYSFMKGTHGRRGNAKRLARLDAMSARLGSPYARATASIMHATAALYEGRYADVEAWAAPAEETFAKRCAGASWEAAFCAAIRYNAVEISGSISMLCENIAALARRATEQGDLMTDLGLTIPRSLVLLAHDQPERARELVASRAQLASTASLMPFLFANRLVDIHHYVGNNLAAWLHWEAIWRAYSRGPFNRVQIPRMILHHQRARCAVGATAERWDDSLAHLARAEARIVLRMDRPESRALAAGVHATLAFQQGKKDRARGQLGDAVAAAAEAGIAPFTDCYRWVLGRITDGSEGAQLFGRADASLRRQGVLNPARWAAVYAPGFGNLEPLDPTQR